MLKKEIIEVLKRVKQDATMKHSSFHIGSRPFPFGAECTDLVREATRLWRETWIIGPLGEVITALEEKAANV